MNRSFIVIIAFITGLYAQAQYSPYPIDDGFLFGDKEFSSRMTFPFETGSYRLRGVDNNVVFITVDDGPTSRVTNAVLDVLEEFDVPATFFVIGEKAARRPQDLRRMVRAGHSVANHTWKHRFDFATADIFIDSLMQSHQTLIPYIQNDLWLFRSPGGIWNSWRTNLGNSDRTLRKYVGPIFWNVGGGNPNRSDDADWKCWSKGVNIRTCSNSYIKQIYRNYEKGQASLVLMHDLKLSSADLLREVLTALGRDRVNWQFKLLREIPSIKEYARK